MARRGSAQASIPHAVPYQGLWGPVTYSDLRQYAAERRKDPYIGGLLVMFDCSAGMSGYPPLGSPDSGLGKAAMVYSWNTRTGTWSAPDIRGFTVVKSLRLWIKKRV